MDLNAMDAHRRAIRLWLYVVAALVVLMVMVGGATRLTDSGLSIVEWRPIAGTVPPLHKAAWILTFEKHKTSPESELVTKGMPLGEFNTLYCGMRPPIAGARDRRGPGATLFFSFAAD
jgi:cytochrome c oxidase assembly protein subunit 15